MTMTPDDPASLVRELASMLAGTGIGLLEFRSAAGHFHLRRDGGQDVVAGPRTPDPVDGAPAPSGTPAGTPGGTVIKAGSPGVFLRHHPLGATPLVQPGQSVRKGEPVGLLRVGPLLLPVPAPRDGVVDAMLAADGAVIGYGAPVARLSPAQLLPGHLLSGRLGPA